jgi:hypothetical protein
MPALKTSSQHTWVAAATIDLSSRQARQADFRGFIKVVDQTRVDIMEVYCGSCHRPYDDVLGEPCQVGVVGNEHLRGGPIGERMKRKGRHPYHDCEAAGCTLLPDEREPRPVDTRVRKLNGVT